MIVEILALIVPVIALIALFYGDEFFRLIRSAVRDRTKARKLSKREMIQLLSDAEIHRVIDEIVKERLNARLPAAVEEYLLSDRQLEGSVFDQKLKKLRGDRPSADQ